MRSPAFLGLLACAVVLTSGCAPLRWIGHAIKVLGTPPAPSVQDVPKPFTGTVVGVESGHRLRVMTKNLRTVKVQLAGLEAPDPAQNAQARALLTELCAHATLRVRPTRGNRGEWRVAQVWAGDRWLNLAMVQSGLVRPQPNADSRLLNAAAQATPGRGTPAR